MFAPNSAWASIVYPKPLLHDLKPQAVTAYTNPCGSPTWPHPTSGFGVCDLRGVWDLGFRVSGWVQGFRVWSLRPRV